MSKRVVVRRAGVVLHGTVVGPLRGGAAVPGAVGHEIKGATVVRVDRADWGSIPTGSDDLPGVMPGARGNSGGALEFRDVIVRGAVEEA